jgi:hypothetical protein
MPDEHMQDTPQADPAPGATPPAGNGADQETERYAGKSTAEVVQMHREAQRKLTEVTQQNSTFRSFFKEVQPWIDVDPHSGAISLNKKTVLPHIQSEGWLPQQGTPTQDNGAHQTDPLMNGFENQFEDNPQAALNSLVQKEVAKAREEIEKEQVQPIRQRLAQTEQATWVEKLENAAPEFKDRDAKRELGQFIVDNKLPEPDSFQTLSRYYGWLQQSQGKLVSRAESEAREGQLRQTLGAVGPEYAHFAPQKDTKPEDDLFGTKSAGPDAGVLDELMG